MTRAVMMENGDAAGQPLHGLLGADARRELVPPEGFADVVRASVAEPDHQQEKADELPTDGEVVAQPDEGAAEHAT